MKFNILNNEPLQFYNSQGVLIGTIEISGSGDMILRPESGSSKDIILGNRDTVGDVEIGLPSAESTLKLMGGGLISANGGTLTIGDSAAGDQLILAVPVTASLVNSASFAVTASHLIGGGGGGSTDTGSLLLTASVSSNTITFTKGDNTTFPITVNTGSGGGGGGGIFSASGSFQETINNLIISGSVFASSSLSVINSGSSIFDVQGSVGQLFEVQDGLDGVLMSVNDISGIPILTVSSSGDVILAEGSTLQGTAATASFVAGVSAAFPFTGSAGIKGSLDITGSGNDIFKVRSESGSLFSVDNGLDGVLMSVNDISGLPLFEVSSSGDVDIHEGKLSGSYATTASFGHLLVNGISVSASITGPGVTGSSLITASVSSNTVTFTKGDGSTFPIVIATGSGGTDITALNTFTGSANTSITALNAATGSYATTSSATLTDLIITNLSGSIAIGTGTTHSIAVTVVDDGANRFVLDGVKTGSLNLNSGDAYRFDQSDNTNNNHPIAFKISGSDTSYTTGVSASGTPGNAGASTLVSVTTTTPNLIYYCTVHGNGMGGNGAGILTVLTGSIIENGFLEVSGSTRLSGSLDVLKAVTASFFKGDGNGLTNIGSTSLNGISLGNSTIVGDGASSATSYGNAFGKSATSTGGQNVAVGAFSNAKAGGVSIGQSTAGGNYTVAIGNDVGNTNGEYNVLIGDRAGNNSSGDYNISLGYLAGYNQTSGNGNITIGSGSRGVAGESNQLRIGHGLHGATISGSLATGHVILSGSTGGLTVQSSGSTLFEVIGSEGTIFSLDDDLDGTLFTVNDRSGIPMFEVSASGRIVAEEGEAIIRSQRPIVTVATNPFTASADTVGQYFRVGGNVTCSIFVSASVHCPVGAEFDFFQTSSAGNMLFETGSGVTLNSKNGNLNLAGQFSSATLKYVNNDEWDLMGDLT